MNLQAKLDAFKVQFESGGPPFNVPKEIVAGIRRGISDMVSSDMAKNAKRVGDKAPSFTLIGPDEKPVSSASLLADGPLVVSFYRGIWCPYCNIELDALQEAIPSIERLGAKLVAISPQTPLNSRKAARDKKLTFPILSDTNNDVANEFGLKFKLPANIIEILAALKIDLPTVNGEASWTLPMPARYVIAQDGTIVYAEVNPDYTHRPDPEEMLPALKKVSKVSV